ncbi:MAG: hypothetical protein ABIF84_02015 [Patescibacteria group bacterium]
MLIRAKKVIGLKALTRSGQPLGRVADFEIEGVGQNIVKYYIQGEIFGFLKESLVINASQVIEIKKDRLIVEDAIIAEKSAKKKISSGVEYVR